MKLRRLFPAIGILLFVYIVWNIGAEKIVNAFMQIPLYLFAISLLIFIPRLFLSTTRWQYICKKQKINVGFFYLLKLTLISIFYGSVTPATVGSHIRILYLKEKGNTTIEKAVTNSLIDATLAFLSILFLALVGSLILINYIPGIFPVVLFFFLFYVFLFVLLMKHERGSKVFHYVIKPFIPAKFKEIVGDSIDSLYEDIPRIRDMLFIPMILNILIFILANTQVYVISLAFPIGISYLDFILIVSISTVAATIPVSIAGLGVREGVLVVILSVYGVDPSTAFVISIGGFLVKTFFPGLAGLIFSIQEK